MTDIKQLNDRTKSLGDQLLKEFPELEGLTLVFSFRHGTDNSSTAISILADEPANDGHDIFRMLSAIKGCEARYTQHLFEMLTGFIHERMTHADRQPAGTSPTP